MFVLLLTCEQVVSSNLTAPTNVLHAVRQHLRELRDISSKQPSVSVRFCILARYSKLG